MRPWPPEGTGAAGKFKMATNLDIPMAQQTTFHGYDGLKPRVMLALYKDGVPVNERPKAMAASWCWTTPLLRRVRRPGGRPGRAAFRAWHLAVEDTQKIQATVFGHHGVVKTGKLRLAMVSPPGRHPGPRPHGPSSLCHSPDAQGPA